MDFFEHQAQAKAASKRLLFLFLLLTFVVVLGVDGVFYMALAVFQADHANPVSLQGFIDWQLSLPGLAAAAVSVIILSIGCFMRWLDLRKGGGGLAVQIGARSLGFASKEDKEQQLINVVAEMAIAAGITAPSVYVLDNESSINAFVVGYELEDTVMVVTRGLLSSMSRDELQAVVGHEFSHVLHGDNRVNIHLMIMIAGFAWVGEIGRALTSRHAYGRSGFRRRSYSSASNKSRQQAVAIGIPLIIIGFVGTLCGRLIRTSISRKREYLADASSVQFTRNPEALASALNVIRSHSHQGYLKNARAEELSHMCISPSNKSSCFASHPPLEDRINTISPTFIKRFDVREKKSQRDDHKKAQQKQTTQAAQGMYQNDIARMQLEANHYLHDVVGTLNVENLSYAMSLHEQMPHEYRQALHNPEHAKYVLLYLLLDDEAGLRQAQLEWIHGQYPNSKSYLKNLSLMSDGLQSRLALPMVELLIPLLKTINDKAKKDLLQQVLLLAKWDGKLSLFEISLYSLLKHTFEAANVNRSSYSIKKLELASYEVNLLVSSLIHNTSGDESAKALLHERMFSIFAIKYTGLIPQQDIQVKQLYSSLKKLKVLSPMLKRTLMDVCGDIVMHDGIVQGSEYETLKLMSIVLSCPLPAMMPRP